MLMLSSAIAVSLSAPVSRFFSFMDENHDNELSPRELATFACATSRCHDTVDNIVKQAAAFIRRFDSDGSGSLSVKELAARIGEKALSPILSGPQQVHLMTTCDPTEMTVMWVTKEKVDSVVRYGLDTGRLDQEANGTISTYNVGILGGWHGWIHHVRLTGLKTATRYYYQAGSSQEAKWSKTYSFTTTPAPSDASFASQTVAVLGDMGTYIPAGFLVKDQIAAEHKKIPFNFVLHAGDVSYAGTGGGWEIEEIWDIWENMVEPIAANVPWMFAVGNHEMWYNFTAYLARFDMPGAQSGGNTNFWWSMDYGLAHYTFISTEHPIDTQSPQYSWLLQDLAAASQPARRALRPWLIVTGHRPLYNSDTVEYDDHRPGSWRPALLEPLFLKFGVDLYISGHMHMYERVHPNVNGTVLQTGNIYINPKAPVYMTQGNAGVFTDTDYVLPPPPWSAARNGYFGFARMTVNATHLHYQSLREHDGATSDEYWIVKP